MIDEGQKAYFVKRRKHSSQNMSSLLRCQIRPIRHLFENVWKNDCRWVTTKSVLLWQQSVKAFSRENDTHCQCCQRRRLAATWKTRMKIDGVRSVGEEERSRLQRFPWHEQIDTTAPPPKCRVLIGF